MCIQMVAVSNVEIIEHGECRVQNLIIFGLSVCYIDVESVAAVPSENVDTRNTILSPPLVCNVPKSIF